jgi:DNA-directed RNA polymerase specialized sigma24 family protein
MSDVSHILQQIESGDHLGTTHPRQVKVAKMRLFLQLTFVEIAEVMSLSADTAESDWDFARDWLKREWGQTPQDSL